MTHATIATDLHQALDVQRHLAAEVTLNLEIVVDVLAQLADVGFGQVLDTGVRIDALLRRGG